MPEKKKLTVKEREKINAQIADLQAALKEQDEAEGAEEAAEAAEDVAEQQEELASLFDRLGITEQDWDVLSGAISAGTEQRTRQIVREELAAEEEEQGLGELHEHPEAGPAHERKLKSDGPPPSGHWTQKKIWGKDKPPEGEE